MVNLISKKLQKELDDAQKKQDDWTRNIVEALIKEEEKYPVYGSGLDSLVIPDVKSLEKVMDDAECQQ